MVEKGILDSNEDLVSEVYFKSPLRYSMKVISPDRYAGSAFVYSGGKLYLYFPKTKYEVIYDGLPEPTSEDLKTLIEKGFDYNMQNYEYELGSSSKILAYTVNELMFRNKSHSPQVQSGSSKIYDDLSFPISGDLSFRDGQKYSFAFTQIEFNKPISEEHFAIPEQKADVVSEWSFHSPSLTFTDAKAHANFKFGLPTKLPDGFVLKKIIKQKGIVPAFTAMYVNPPYFLNIVSFKNYDLRLVPTGRGIHIKGKSAGELLPNPHLSSYSFSKAGISYVLSGNVSIDDLLMTAESL
jgi:hypothetical protein